MEAQPQDKMLNRITLARSVWMELQKVRKHGTERGEKTERVRQTDRVERTVSCRGDKWGHINDRGASDVITNGGAALKHE